MEKPTSIPHGASLNDNECPTFTSGSVVRQRPPSERRPNNKLTWDRGNSNTLLENDEGLCRHKKLLGDLRCDSEIRQLGAFLLSLGMGAAFSTKALISYLLEGMAGSSQVEGFLLPVLVGNFLQLVCGLTAVATGIIAIIMAPLHSQMFHTWVKIAVAVINLGPITFVITIVRLIQGARDPPDANSFIPLSLGPRRDDVKFCAAMGILVLISVCATLVGGLTLIGLHLCAILGRQPHSRHQAYHRIRFGYYAFLVWVGGMSQLLLGIYLWIRFGAGPYDQPVHVAAFTVHFPLVSVIVGALQTTMGIHGFFRAVGYSSMFCKSRSTTHPKDDHSHFIFIGFVWIVSTFLQFVLQPAYSSDDTYNAEGATVASVYVGFFAMPAYLDYLVRTTPVEPRPEHYGLAEDTPYKEDLLVVLFGVSPKASRLRDVGTESTLDEDQEGRGCKHREGRELKDRKSLGSKASFESTEELTESFKSPIQTV